MARLEIVHHHDFLPGRRQGMDRVGTDIARPAANKDRHTDLHSKDDDGGTLRCLPPAGKARDAGDREGDGADMKKRGVHGQTPRKAQDAPRRRPGSFCGYNAARTAAANSCTASGASLAVPSTFSPSATIRAPRSLPLASMASTAPQKCV